MSLFINGIVLSREYFITKAMPSLQHEFKDIYPRLAAGLVGNGSQCFGYDDEISCDHDWGIDFYIWTLKKDEHFIPALREWKSRLFIESPPEISITRSPYGSNIDVMTCEDFYSQLIGYPQGPKSLDEWRRVPEENFAISVNGEVFIDGPGEFRNTRKYLLGFYPEDIRKKKISSCCMALAQTGQYNLIRTEKRKDRVTFRTILSRFNDSAITMVFLLNKTFRPYYKWAYRRMKELPILGKEAGVLLYRIASVEGFNAGDVTEIKNNIDKLCNLFINELRNQKLAFSDDKFLAIHGEEVRSCIQDNFLRSLPAQIEI